MRAVVGHDTPVNHGVCRSGPVFAQTRSQRGTWHYYHLSYSSMVRVHTSIASLVQRCRRWYGRTSHIVLSAALFWENEGVRTHGRWACWTPVVCVHTYRTYSRDKRFHVKKTTAGTRTKKRHHHQQCDRRAEEQREIVLRLLKMILETTFALTQVARSSNNSCCGAYRGITGVHS